MTHDKIHRHEQDQIQNRRKQMEGISREAISVTADITYVFHVNCGCGKDFRMGLPEPGTPISTAPLTDAFAVLEAAHKHSRTTGHSMDVFGRIKNNQKELRARYNFVNGTGKGRSRENVEKAGRSNSRC